MKEDTFCKCALQLLTDLDSLLSCVVLFSSSISEDDLPEDPFKLDCAGTTADVGFHHQIILITGSQDHSSSI